MTTSDLRCLAKEKGGGILSLEIAWAQALERAENSGLNLATIAFLSKGFGLPSTLIKLIESLPQEREGDDWLVRALQQKANDSSYSLQEWVEALESLLQYLVREKRSSNLDTAIGYVACAAEYLSQGSLTLSLSEGVSDFLTEFGYEG